MTTRADLRSELRNRLHDAGAAIWEDEELNGYIEQAVKSLYPHWYLFETGTETAGPGPVQSLPIGLSGDIAKNLHYVGLRKPTSTRVRTIRGWQEGNGQVMVPKVDDAVEGFILVFAWTIPHRAPDDDVTDLTIPANAEEVVVLRSQVTALERVLADRVKSAKYFAVQVREGVSEQDIAVTLDALHASIDSRMKDAPGPPERVG